MLRRILRWSLIGGTVVLLLIQLVPYGRAHTNPPIRSEPAWNSEQTRAYARLACFDCHSNETVWPWYSNVAPISWLVQRDVDEGRAKLNFSEWDRPQEAEDVAETVQEGEMPPRIYTVLHPSARLSQAELHSFTQGLIATFGADEYDENEDDEGRAPPWQVARP